MIHHTFHSRIFHNTRGSVYRVLIALLALTVLLNAQRPEPAAVKVKPRFEQLEIPDDPYRPVSRQAQPAAPAYRYSSAQFFTVQVNVNASGDNIIGDAANEPSIAIDPSDPLKMAIGWRQFNTVASNFREAGYGYTTDGGETWTFPGVIEPGVFRSDPVLDSDIDGNFYYNSLEVGSTYLKCDVFKSTDGGASWGSKTPAQGGDKAWMTIDKSGGIGTGNIYLFWQPNISFCPDSSFTRSVNGGFSYEDCGITPEGPVAGTLAVGPDGELYGFGARTSTFSDFVVTKSTNAQDSSQAVLWDFATVVDMGGTFAPFVAPNPQGLSGQAWVAVDHSGGPYRGNVYLLSSVNPDGSPDSLDVMFVRSTDGGSTWSSPIRINDDPGDDAWQWFGTMSIAPNGRIDVIWLDTRNDPDGYDSELFYASSVDGGETWSPNVPISDAFDPHLGWPNQNKLGDYFHMISDDNFAHLAWAATFNGEQDIYYGRIIPFFSGIDDGENPANRADRFSLAQNYPNPFNPSTVISYQLSVAGDVNLSVFNLLGERVATLVSEPQSAGNHRVSWDGRDRSGRAVSSGIFIYKLQVDGHYSSRKMLLIK